MPGISLGGMDAAGAVISAVQTVMTVNGAPVVTVGSPVADHGKSPHKGVTMTAGSSVMSIDGIPVCRAGDPASCGHTASGQGWFNVD